MDGYPAGSLDHNIPLLIVSGLTPASDTHFLGDPQLKDTATLVRSELPPLEGKEPGVILKHLQENDSSSFPWNGTHPLRHRFRIRVTGRTFYLPPRRARIPEGFSPDLGAASQAQPVLHSPFSPLSPASQLYPDGLVDAKWLQKHQDMVPSVYLCLYSLTADPTLVTLHDSKIRSDIASIKNMLNQSGYKTRLAVVILGDTTIPSSHNDIQDRLEVIRRGTGLDHKMFLYIPPQQSDEELKAAMDAILTALFSQSMDYYRELIRHAKKKRNRGIAPQPTVPPTSGTSRTLSLQGWNVRYDFKSAIFAEFRQEMDVALRSFEAAYKLLLGADVWEIIPNWSPRWNEARLLADIIAIRILRCLQWMGQWSASVRRWRQHREKMNDFVDRRGLGTDTYGWEAWQARWAMVMANMMDKVEIMELSPSTLTIFMEPEKTLVAERLQPWDHLHHPGYWYRLAARHLVARRNRAYDIPEDDRKPPDRPSASQLASKTHTYDTYMCPEPYEEYPIGHSGVNHSQLILEALTAAQTEFRLRQQHRLSAELALESAQELVDMKDYAKALELLKPLWEDMSFRAEGWWDVAEKLSWMLREAAKMSQAGEILVVIDWELLNRNFTRNPDWEYDITKSLEGLSLDAKPLIAVTDEQILSFVAVSFAFKTEEGKAGETCQAQLSFTSNAFSDSAPVVLHSIEVQFEGSIKPITITHKPNTSKMRAKNNVLLSVTDLMEAIREDGDGDSEDETIMSLIGEDDLTLTPGQTRVLEMSIPLREQGDAAAKSLRMGVVTDSFSLDYHTSFKETSTADVWYTQSSLRKRLSRTQPHNIHILPRPPKMVVAHVNPREQYYMNETMVLEIELTNAEDVDAVTKLDVNVYGEDLPEISLETKEVSMQCARSEAGSISGVVSLGTLDAAKSTRAKIIVGPAERPVEYGFIVKAMYHLVTDPATPISQDLEFRLAISNPFEANYELVPRLHPDPWPCMFDPTGLDLADAEGQAQPRGLAQKWLLSTRYASFALEDLRIMDLDVKVLQTQGSIHCTVFKRQEIPKEGLEVSPRTMESAAFDVVSQRMSLDDPPAQASMEISFVIKWKRLDTAGDMVNTTCLPAPRLYVSIAEPRVLASVEYLNKSTGLISLTIMIENPSHHFLTFGVTMDPSDQFGFSGPKNYTLNLVPVSRRAVTVRLLPYARGTWIRPGLMVRDKYFQKVLRILATDGMKMDKEGILIWVPAGDDGEEEE